MPETDWTVKDGRANSSDQFVKLCAVVEKLIRGSAHDLIAGRADSVAGLILARLAHKHGLRPGDAGEETEPVFAIDPDGSVRFRYRNYRGDVAMRHVRFHRGGGSLIWGKTEHHPEEQWLLEAWDEDRQMHRTFALKDILAPE
jgi:hypothetical protein